ncbi:serine acetyltransferase [Enterobacter cancerogenus]|uniref:Serine acetyltransferase n=1 Tax=Enterobacter cancerogenus TaxID=69218 RepID=A0AB38P4S2_9ENTR|nr:serine acetyltransferase [Enterobacter cancerogenus]TKK18926.1 serine acetyltransferase [Enterobacter cancerogenus]
MDKKLRSEHLRECLRREVMMNSKPFTWFRVLHKAMKCPDRRFHFWWRIASYWHHSDSKFLRVRALKINRKLIFKYGTDIQLGAHIGPGMVISHHQGIVVNGSAVIGHSLRIRQNTTIGLTGANVNKEAISIVIGDNVSIGAGSCIIADKIRIGDNVVIGAMSFVNKDIPSDVTVYNEKTLHVLSNRSHEA